MQSHPVLTKIQLLPRPQKLLSRPRLLDFLSDHAGAKLAAISAAAGYGKTSLLVDCAHRAEVPVCWYTLDRFDRDPGTFFAHLVASVRQQFPDFGQQSEVTLASLQNPIRDWPALAAATINELYETIPDYFTIVLDDYHHIEDVVSINEFLAYLLQYSDEHCHLIVASRRLPRLPNQALLLGRGQMVGLDTEDLRFTAQEIQALVRQNYGLDLPPDKATGLAEHFEGWITGILLTAQSGWAELLEDAIRVQTAGQVYDYLAEQVFADQPPDLQTFSPGERSFGQDERRNAGHLAGGRRFGDQAGAGGQPQPLSDPPRRRKPAVPLPPAFPWLFAEPVAPEGTEAVLYGVFAGLVPNFGIRMVLHLLAGNLLFLWAYALEICRSERLRVPCPWFVSGTKGMGLVSLCYNQDSICRRR